MELIVQHIDIIVTALVTLFGSGIFFWRENKAKLKLENAKKESEVALAKEETINTTNDGWKDLYNKLLSSYNATTEDNKKLVEQINDMHKEYNELMLHYKDLELRAQEIEFWKCLVRGCPKRVPPQPTDAIAADIDNQK